MFNNHLMKVCLAAVFAIGLAACSSSSDQAAPAPTPTDPPPPTQAEQDLEELKNEIAALRTQLGIDDTTDIGTTVAELQATLKELQDAAAKLVSDAAVKAAGELFTGLGDATNFVVDTIAVTDKDGGGGMATFTSAGSTPLVPGVAGDDAMKSAEPMLGEWQGTMLTDSNEAGASTTVVVYTDIEAAKSVPFGDVYTLDANGNLAGTGDANANVLHADNRSKVMASAFMHTGRKNHDPDPAVTDEVVSISGTFNGASGEYRCTESGANTCASHDAGDGMVRLEGAWIFDPNPNAMATMADASYSYFGWWLNKGTETEGTEAGVFHGVTDGSTPASLGAPTAATFTALGGTATYTGDAAGLHAADGSVTKFLADVELVADFDTDSLGGTVDAFRSLSGVALGDLSVTLEETTFLQTGDAFSGSTGADVPGSGHWGARWADDKGWNVGGTFGFAADDESVALLGAFQACACAPVDNGNPDDAVATEN